MNGGELNINRPGLGWCVELMDWRHECRCLFRRWGTNSRDLDVCKIRPELRWNAHLETWIGWDGAEMQFSIFGWRWDVPCMEVRHDLDGGEARILGPWCNVGTLMEVKWYMDVGETSILGPGCRWERTWKHLTSTFWDLGGFEVT